VEIQHLRYFVHICRLGSFAKAADMCFVSSQGISVAIRRMEEQLSCKLFERSSKGAVMTEHALYLLPIAEKVVVLMDSCEEYFISGRAKNQNLSVIITWGAQSAFADVPIAEFKKRYPMIFLEISQGYDYQCEDALDAREAELALTVGPIDHTRFDSEFVYSTRYGILTHKDDPLAARRTVSIRDLDGVPLIMMREHNKTFSLLSSAAEAVGVTLTVKQRVDHALLTHQYVDLTRTTGITTEMFAPKFEGTDLRFIPFDDPELSWALYIVKPRGHTLSAAAELLVQILTQHRDNMLMDRTLGGAS
jgi:DNA-binding transcriptional LysR family regulator